MRDRTTADLERELHMLAAVRAYLRDAEGTDVRIPTTAVDRVLDELHQTRTTDPTTSNTALGRDRSADSSRARPTI
ncbi:hypothetical protein Rhow_004572 [Rhodococcus wratislaviensis]|uniref:Uncharacterized protein n=1 Tax=Rhodococcus wratislaviensis TaxID=44752 RepID=A0A402CBE9_RHOWR|nr:hypothetical protein [Rhodococcus wratislaviensis]GCE40929.1 hypothetical protein Rhow_004572 [Rhodococcus wratislaviensis]